MALSSGCELRHCCLAWTTESQLIIMGDRLTSPPFFLNMQRCQLTLSIDYSVSNNCFMFSLRVEADREDQSNYRTSVALEHGGVTGLTTSGVFGHSHPSPQTIWKYTLEEIRAIFPDFFTSSLPLKFVLSFVSTTAGDDGQGTEPTLGRAQNDKSVQTLSCMDSCLEILSEDFAKLLDEGSEPDVEFLCADCSIKAHKNVLCTRSPVFASMLKNDMVESKTGQVKIQDMTAAIFQQFLRYLYTGRIKEQLDVDTAMGLYEAGDKYAVKRLVRRCADFLAENLTDDNACEVLVLAYAHSDVIFTEAAIDYILRQEIPLQRQWLTFCETHPKIANEVLNRSYRLQKAVF